MPLPAFIIPVLALAAASEDPTITVRAYPWAPFISPMGEPFRGNSTGQAPIARWFARADQNRDGMLTADEIQADADAFFTRLDGNRDGQIDPDEIKVYEWEIAPEIQVNSSWRRPRGQAAPQPAKPETGLDRHLGDQGWQRRGDDHDGYQIDGLQGAARYGLLNIPQPVTSADADFNRAISLAEFRQAAETRFRLLDSSGQGRIGLAELEARLPIRPEGRRKRHKNASDTRIGQPFPRSE